METSTKLIWERQCRDGIVKVYSETFTKSTPTYIVTGPLVNSAELHLLSGFSEKAAIDFATSRCIEFTGWLQSKENHYGKNETRQGENPCERND